MNNPITVVTTIIAPIQKVWEALTTPSSIQQWCHASDDWGVGEATNDMRVGGRFTTEMKALDGSTSFVFGGTYTAVTMPTSYAYTMDGEDARKVVVTLAESDAGVVVTEQFEPETENPRDMQQQGWQAILENFKKFVEAQ
jgi:uncharacterized protein YndB with AHSA1/START domain